MDPFQAIAGAEYFSERAKRIGRLVERLFGRSFARVFARGFAWISGSTIALVLAGAVLMVGSADTAHAQELDCTVSVNYSSLSGSDFSRLSELEPLIQEYLNDHRWTDDRFQAHERIDCSFNLTFVGNPSVDQFNVRLTVVSRRPIYGTMQFSPVIQHMDNNWSFTYVENQSLVHDLNRHDPLTSVLDFYAYLILGYDYDTFSELGGTPYFDQARSIAELAQSSGGPGWDPNATQSRGALIDQILDPTMEPLRAAYFQYHYHGLDHFTSETESARKAMFEAVSSINELLRNVSSNYAISLFFSTKYEELTAAFQQGDLQNQAYQVLLEADPSHSSTYNQLVGGG